MCTLTLCILVKFISQSSQPFKKEMCIIRNVTVYFQLNCKNLFDEPPYLTLALWLRPTQWDDTHVSTTVTGSNQAPFIA